MFVKIPLNSLFLGREERSGALDEQKEKGDLVEKDGDVWRLEGC